jgi:anti-sigma B factor antagonist
MAAPADTPGAHGGRRLGDTDIPSLFAGRRTADASPNEAESAESPLGEGRIDVELSRDVWILTVRGDHDISTQASLREQLELVADAGGPIVVDLSHASFVDSTVIGALAAAVADQDGPPLTMVAPDNYVGTRMVELVGIGTKVPVFRTRAEAVTAHLRHPIDDVVPAIVDHKNQFAHGSTAAAAPARTEEPGREHSVERREPTAK